MIQIQNIESVFWSFTPYYKLSLSFTVMAAALKIVDVVPKFSGDDAADLEQWLDRFQTSVKVATQESDAAKLSQLCASVIPLVLTGSAYSTWKRVTAQDDLQEIKAALRSAYGLTIIDADRELKGLRLLPGGNVDALAVRAQELLQIISRGKDVPEQFVSLAVLNAIPMRIADEVRLRHGKELELTAVVDCAKSLWRNYEAETPLTMALAATTGNRDVRSPPYASAQPQATAVRCYGCRRTGHIRRDCPVQCFNCGERGHFRRDCPKATMATSSGNASAGAATPGQATPAVL